MDIHRGRFVPFPPSSINALAFSHAPPTDDSEDPDTLRLAIGRGNGNIEIWNPNQGAWLQERVFSGGKERSVEALAWIQEPDEEDDRGKTVPGRLRLFSIGYSSIITEWDLVKGVPARHSDGNHSEVWCFAPQPRLDTSSKNKVNSAKPMVQNLVAGCADGTLVILSTVDGELRFDRFLSKPSAKRARVLSVTYKDRSIVLAGYADSMIRVFDTRNGQTLRNISLGQGPLGGPREILVWKVKCLPNGDFFSGDSTGDVRFFDGKNYSQIQRISGHEADILDIGASRDGSYVYSAGMDRRTSVYTCAKRGPRQPNELRWRKLQHKRYHEHDVKALATYDGKTISVLVSGGIDTQPMLVPIRGYGEELSRALPFLPTNPPLDSAPGPRLMLSWWNCEIRIWRVKKQRDATEKPKIVARIALEGEENITSATISKDGRLLAAATASGVKLFQLSVPRLDAGTGLRIRKLRSPTIPGAKLVKFSADGKWLAIATYADQVLLARTVLPTEGEGRPRVVPHILQLHRLQRSSETCDALNGSWGSYNRSIIHADFSDDGTALAVADIAGYIDTWVIEGYEDSTVPEVDEAGSLASLRDDDESDMEDDDQRRRVTIFGQRWVPNPSGHLLPKVDSTPLLISFEPVLEDSRPQPNGNPAVHPTRGNPHPHSRDIVATEQRIFVVTAQHSLYEFEMLAGRLSEWSRRNPSISYPEQFRLVDTPAKGCVWDVTSQHKRVWLYGEQWLFMFDLSQDFPFPGSSGDWAQSKKRKREFGANDTPRRGHSGAGGAVPEKEAPVTKMRKLVNGKSDEAHGQKWVDLDAGLGAETEERREDDEQALATLRRAAGTGGGRSQANGEKHTPGRGAPPDKLQGDESKENADARATWWYTFKYRPILGIVAISEGTQPLEVVLVERPKWELELPPRFVGTHE